MNRMGIPARVSRRKLPPRPRGPTPRIARVGGAVVNGGCNGNGVFMVAVGVNGGD